MTDDQAALAGFGGTARLFPLPNLVLFPQVVQGLHVFEPRYREMAADALAGDRLIGLVLLRPGWKEDDYDRSPPVHDVGCLSRITHHERLPDGRFNLRVRGLARLRLVEETASGKPYRTARAEPVADVMPADLGRLTLLRRHLADAVLPRFEPSGSAHTQLAELFAGDLPLGQVCDLLAYALPVPIELKQQLLDEACVETRAEVLVHALQVPKPHLPRRFPPGFSAN